MVVTCYPGGPYVGFRNLVYLPLIAQWDRLSLCYRSRQKALVLEHQWPKIKVRKPPRNSI